MNSYPTAGLTAASLLYPGNSVYGYAQAAQPFTIDPAQVLDRSARLTEIMAVSGRQALTDYNGTVNGALQLAADADRTSKNAAIAYAAIAANQQSGGSPSQSLSFRATVTNGRLSIEQADGSQQLQQPQAERPPCPDCHVPADSSVPPPAPNGTLSFSAASAGGLAICARCHDGRGTHGEPKEIVYSLDRSYSPQELERVKNVMESGKMPPKSHGTLTVRQQLDVIGEMARLVQ